MSESGDWSTPDRVRSVLALVVVIGGLVAITVVRLAVPTPGDFVTGVIALMSGVLGWYFGTRGVERAESQAVEAVQETAEANARTSTVEQLGLDIDSSAREYEKVIEAARSQPAVHAALQAIVAEVRKQDSDATKD